MVRNKFYLQNIKLFKLAIDKISKLVDELKRNCEWRMKTLYIAKKSTIEWIKDKLFLISFLNIRETVVYGRKI